jgi:uncharacterized surface protein with fasciclin (FAS1) repeats
MKRKIFAIILAVSVLSFSMTSFGAAQSKGSKKSIYQTAKDAKNFTILTAALDKANLKDVFTNKGKYTVFAPTDAAFKNFLKENNLTAEQLLSNPDLPNILKYHVLGKVYSAKDVLKLKDKTNIKTLSGKELVVNKKKNGLFINTSKVIKTDIYASNGVIHVIDKVLVPETVKPKETILTIAQQAGSFTTLIAALEKAHLADVFKKPGEYTVFAPTDEAFALFLKNNNLTAQQLLDSPKLADVLKYHVIKKEVFSSDLKKIIDKKSFKTLEGGKVTLLKINKKLFVNTAYVTTADIDASNGVVHVINRVLVPKSFSK